MAALREVFARFAFAFDGKAGLANASRGVDTLKSKAAGASESIGSLAAGLASAFAGNALLSGVNAFAAQLDTLDDLSAQTGVATEELQVYGYAAQKSGASTEEFNASLSLLQKSLGKTTEATGTQVDALKDLGVDTSKPRELADVLPEIFAGFSKLPTSAKKAEVATSLFGRAGVRLIPTLERGQEGMAALRAELEESGGIVSADTIAKAGEYRDNLARVDRAVFALKGTLAGALFPQLSKVVTVVAKGIGGLSDFAKGTTLAENAGLALAATLAGPVLSAFGPFIGKGLKFAAVFAAVDDVIGFLNGKQSLIADILDGAFGHGTATAVRNWVNDAIGALSLFANSADATYAAMGDSSQSFTTRALAMFVGFTRDAAAGFPAFRAGFVGTLDEMFADVVDFVAKALEAWAKFTGQLTLPPALQAALALVPGGAAVAAGAAGAGATSEAAAGAAASLRETAGRAHAAAQDRFAEAQAGAQGIRSNVFGTAAGGDAARQLLDARKAVNDALVSTGLPGLGDLGGVHARTDSVNAQVNARESAIAGVPAADAVLAQAQAAGTTIQLNDNKTISFKFDGSTKPDQKTIDALTAAVRTEIAAGNRAAVEALAQKAKK